MSMRLPPARVNDRSIWLPWTLAAFTGCFAAVEFVVTVHNDSTPVHRLNAGDWLVGTVIFLLPLSFAGVGAFILTRRPGNRIGWLMVAVGLGFAIGSLTSDYPRIDALTHQPTRPLASSIAWIQAWIWSFQLGALFLLLLFFPTGDLPNRRWRPVMWIGGADLLAYGVIGAVARGPIENVPFDNPYGIVSVPDLVTYGGAAIAFAGLAAAAVSLLLRFRTARGVTRQQLKWFAFGASFAIALNIATYYFSWDSFVGIGALVAELALPIFMGIAILRYRLYDIDVLINRTLVYGSLSAALAGIYAMGVVSLQALSHVVVGEGSDIAIVVSTLVIAALFQPLRRRLQTVIDRRFYRRKYDAARTLMSFGARLRNEVDLDQLSSDVLTVIAETLQPAQVSLWLRQEEKRS